MPSATVVLDVKHEPNTRLALHRHTGRALDVDTGDQNHKGRWYEPSIGRWLSEDQIPDANLYRYVGNNPWSGVDPEGLEKITIEGNGVYWNVEGEGNNARQFPIGMFENGMVSLFDAYGGGTVSMPNLEGAAANFWDIYPDISKADSTAQENMVAQAIRRAQLSQPLRAGGASFAQEWVRYAQPEIKAVTAAIKEGVQLRKEYARYAGEDIGAARSVVVQSAQDYARFAQENYEVVDKALGLTTFAKSLGDFVGEKYAAVGRVLGLTELGSKLWNRAVGQVVVAKETANALPHELAHAYGVAERGYEAYRKTRVIDEGATVGGAVQKSLYVGVRYMGERAAGFVKEIGATLVDVSLGLQEIGFNAGVNVGNRLFGTNARYWTAPDLSASMKAVKQQHAAGASYASIAAAGVAQVGLFVLTGGQLPLLQGIYTYLTTGDRQALEGGAAEQFVINFSMTAAGPEGLSPLKGVKIEPTFTETGQVRPWGSETFQGVPLQEPFAPGTVYERVAGREVSGSFQEPGGPVPVEGEVFGLEYLRQVEGVKGKAPSATINEAHVFEGEINPSGKAVGFHSRPGGVNPVGARVTTVTEPPNAQGVYRAKVEVFSPKTNTWIPKKAQSTFFPDSWSKSQVSSEIQGAFQNKVLTNGNYWEGISPNGVRVGGYLDTKGNFDINSAYPIR